MKSRRWALWMFLGLGVLIVLVILLNIAIRRNSIEPTQIGLPLSNQTTSTVPVDPTRETQRVSDMQRAMDAFSVGRMLDFLEKLTSINPHSGWRGAGTEGEAQAFDLLQTHLNELTWLSDHGMTIEKESFSIFVGTQDHTSRVILYTGEVSAEIPADSPRGHRSNLDLVRVIDSDGSVTDLEFDPVSVSSEVVWIPDLNALKDLQGSDLIDKVALLNYAVVDTSIELSLPATEAANLLTDLEPAAVILYTDYSNVNGASHGTFLGDRAGGFQNATWKKRTPLLFIEVENLSPLGIVNSDQLENITFAEVEWDMDVINPAPSGNLIVHIPGPKGSKPVLLSAHIDSPNSPGALDDGSGSAILLEIATVLNEQQILPTVDLYIVWYGSEETGLFGSAYFTTTHSELINRLQANIQVDCLTRPVEGVPGVVNLGFSQYRGDEVSDDPIGRYLEKQGQDLGIDTVTTFWPFASDNGSLSAFYVSNLNMIYESQEMSEIYGGVWYAGHMHDPYDTLERAIEMKEVFGQMGRLTLSAAFIPLEEQHMNARELPHQALFIASHTETPQMSPTALVWLTQTLLEGGYEVNVLPYGSKLQADDLEGMELVVVMPPYDFAVDDAAPNFDISWSEQEAEIIDNYAQSGGNVIVTNSAFRMMLFSNTADYNEDWSELNTLTDQWQVHFTRQGADSNYYEASLAGDDFELAIAGENAVVFSAPGSTVLAGTSDQALMAEIPVGNGKVLVLADLSALADNYNGSNNPMLVINLLKWLKD